MAVQWLRLSRLNDAFEDRHLFVVGLFRIDNRSSRAEMHTENRKRVRRLSLAQ